MSALDVPAYAGPWHNVTAADIRPEGDPDMDLGITVEHLPGCDPEDDIRPVLVGGVRMSDQGTIAATIESMNAAMAVRTRDWQKRKITDGLELSDAWDRAVASLLAGIAERHLKIADSQDQSSSFCRVCGWFTAEHCPDMTDALAVCAAWNAAVANETVQAGLRVSMEALYAPNTEGAPTA